MNQKILGFIHTLPSLFFVIDFIIRKALPFHHSFPNQDHYTTITCRKHRFGFIIITQHKDDSSSWQASPQLQINGGQKYIVGMASHTSVGTEPSKLFIPKLTSSVMQLQNLVSHGMFNTAAQNDFEYITTTYLNF